MKDKLLKVKEDLHQIHNYNDDLVELKRIKNTLHMYIDIIFPVEEAESWHNMVRYVNFTSPIVTRGLGHIERSLDSGEFQRGKEELSNIIDLIIEKIEIIGENSGAKVSTITSNNKKVFVVHGHDNETKEAVARVIQTLGLEAIILNEKSNQGKTIIEKLEHYGDVGYAVVLLTPCDIGKAQEETEFVPRARQNVIAELGYFIGRLGRNRVSIIHRTNVDIPSDFKGLGYISYNNSSWKFDLARELKSAGYNIDANKLI